MRPLSLAALTVLGLSPEDQIICAERTGYDGVGLRLMPAASTEVFRSILNDSSRKSKVKNLIRSTGIKVFDIEVLRLEPQTNIQDYSSFIEFGAELGAKNILVAGYDPDWSRMADNWMELCDIALPFNIKPHIEPMPWTHVKSYQDGLRLVNEVPNSLGAVLIDPIHFFRTGGDVNQLQENDTKKMGYIQLSDASISIPDSMSEILRQGREDRLPPGKGELPLQELLDKLPTHLPISLEVPLGPKWGCITPEDNASLVLQTTLKFLKKS